MYWALSFLQRRAKINRERHLRLLLFCLFFMGFNIFSSSTTDCKSQKKQDLYDKTFLCVDGWLSPLNSLLGLVGCSSRLVAASSVCCLMTAKDVINHCCKKRSDRENV